MTALGARPRLIQAAGIRGSYSPTCGRALAGGAHTGFAGDRRRGRDAAIGGRFEEETRRSLRTRRNFPGRSRLLEARGTQDWRNVLAIRPGSLKDYNVACRLPISFIEGCF